MCMQPTKRAITQTRFLSLYMIFCFVGVSFRLDFFSIGFFGLVFVLFLFGSFRFLSFRFGRFGCLFVCSFAC